jgi:hypothetical protein
LITSATPAVRRTLRFVSPLLYGAGCVSMFVLIDFVVSSTAVSRSLDALPGASYLFENVALAVVLLVVVCALSFTVLDLALYGLERLRSPVLKDHLRHCALLYAGVVFVLLVLTASNLQAGMLQYDLGFAVCVLATSGILVDAAVVLLMRRPTRVQRGGTS